MMLFLTTRLHELRLLVTRMMKVFNHVFLRDCVFALNFQKMHEVWQIAARQFATFQYLLSCIKLKKVKQQ